MLKFKKTNYITVPRKEQDIPEGMWIKCDACGELLYKEDVVHNHYSCYKCGKYFRLSTKRRLRMVADKQSFEEWDTGLETANPLDYPGYPEKLDGLKEKLHVDEAVTTGVCTIKGEKTVIAVCDARFLMGSMGYVVGEKITRAIEYATDKRLPLIIFSASGGARMQEGIFSLMQMAKTSAALERFNRSGGLYVSVLTHPTTGGVTASFASLGDITLAEPGALIGFAGPRVIEQTIGEKLPDGFQRSEFQLEHGFVDQVVPRTELKEVLTRILQLHTRGRKRR